MRRLAQGIAPGLHKQRIAQPGFLCAPSPATELELLERADDQNRVASRPMAFTASWRVGRLRSTVVFFARPGDGGTGASNPTMTRVSSTESVRLRDIGQLFRIARPRLPPSAAVFDHSRRPAARPHCPDDFGMPA